MLKLSAHPCWPQWLYTLQHYGSSDCSSKIVNHGLPWYAVVLVHNYAALMCTGNECSSSLVVRMITSYTDSQLHQSAGSHSIYIFTGLLRLLLEVSTINALLRNIIILLYCKVLLCMARKRICLKSVVFLLALLSVQVIGLWLWTQEHGLTALLPSHRLMQDAGVQLFKRWGIMLALFYSNTHSLWLGKLCLPKSRCLAHIMTKPLPHTQTLPFWH